MAAKFGSWRKIPQWLAGIVFVGSLGAALTVCALVGLSAPETAKPILTDVFKETLLQTAVADNFAQIQPFLKALPPEEKLTLPGFPELTITNGEAAGLNKDELAGRIAAEIADKSYEKRLALPPESGVTTAAVEPLGAVFSADAHRSISTLSSALWALAILMGAVMVIFSSRFGRPAALGLGLVAGSALPAVVYAALPARLEAIRSSGDDASLQLRMLAPVLESIKPVLENSQRLALQFLLAGIALIVIAVIGGLIWRGEESAA